LKTGIRKTRSNKKKAEGEGTYGHHNADPGSFRCTGYHHLDRFDSTPPHAGEVDLNRKHPAARGEKSFAAKMYPLTEGLRRASGNCPKVLIRRWCRNSVASKPF
jgi:hypothetical protein